jgi:hypothetical protein
VAELPDTYVPKINDPIRIPIDQLIPNDFNPNVMSEEMLGRL